MDKKTPVDDLGRQIGDTVKNALNTGDFSQLKNIGPAVENAIKSVPNINLNQSRNKHSAPNWQGQQDMPQNTGPGKQQVHWPSSGQHWPSHPQPPKPPVKPASVQPSWRGSGLVVNPLGPSPNTGLAGIVFGIIGMVAFGPAALTLGIVGLNSLAFTPGLLAGIFSVPFVLSFMGTVSSAGKRKLASRVRQYYTFLQKKSVCTLDEISLSLNITPQALKKDIKKAMNKGLMPDVRMDTQETSLIWGEDAYRLYLETEQARNELAASQAEHQQRLEDPATAALETFKTEGSNTIKKIRAANAALTEQEISNKLDALEITTSKIFTYVENHPQKLQDTRRFMDYYLPTTLKLLEKYQQYEESEVQVPSIVKAKQEIQQTLDTINLAFHNLLDSLYQDDTLDVSTDIEVLETMLEQEGLTGNKFEIKDEEPQLKL